MTEPQTSPVALTIRLFGPMQVLVHGNPLPALRSRRMLWLLALLTLRHNRPVEREWLAGTLWPEVDQSQAFANLRPLLSELRRGLADQSVRIQSPTRHTLLLDLTGADVDVLLFDAAIASQKLSRLEQVMELYRGPLLEGCNEEWVFQERTAREQGCLQALQKLGDAALSVGDYKQAVRYYQRATGIDPWWESAQRGWMEALAKSGDSNEALLVYRAFVEVLRSDPKAVPDEKTRALYQRLRSEVRQKVGAQVVVATEAIPVPVVQGYLPHPLTDLVGREDERLEVVLLLRRSRLVTLTGMGGIGKTRLAREVASDVVGEYADGVWLVALESLSEGRLVVAQIASVLGLREERGSTPLQSVTEYLRQKRLLLVLDNCEHLLAASAQVVSHLLQECREVRLLATSRAALGITGETIWTVPALTAPDPAHLPQARATLLRVLMGYESVQLFVERAQAVQKSFLLTESNARMVAQACRQLEGIPLAIELAAARVRAMPVEQIASRLEDYLGLLTGGSRTAQSRQQTLRATLDWSYTLLSEAECSVLRRLSVFAGGCHLEAAEFVCSTDEGVQVFRYSGVEEQAEPPRSGTLNTEYRTPNTESVLDLLTSLVDKSLVLFEERGPAEGRYRLLEMVRQYAGESLQASGEAEQVRMRHRDCFLALAEAAEPQLSGAEQAIWLECLETEHDNLRAALAWSETEAQGAEAGLRLAGALEKFWETRGHYSEGRTCLSEALGRDSAVGRTQGRAKALNGAGMLASHQGDYGAARELHEESLAIRRELGDRQGIASSLHNLGAVTYSQGDYEAARTLYEQSLAIRQELGDKGGIAKSLHNLGIVAYMQGDYGATRDLYEQSLAIQRELGDRRGIANLLLNLGSVAYSQGDYGAARELYKETLAAQRELGDRRGIAGTVNNLGSVAYSQRDYGAARELYEESLALKRDLGDKGGIASSLSNVGNVAYSQGDYDAAQTLYKQSLAIQRELGNKWGIAYSLHSLGEVASSQGDYEAARTLLKESLAIKRELGHKEGIAYSLTGLGTVAYIQGDYEAARTLLKESLAIQRDLGDHTIASTLEGMAKLELAVREPLHAARLWGTAERLREETGSPLEQRSRPEYEQQLAAARAAVGNVVAFDAAWEEGRAMTMEQAVSYALKLEGVSPKP